MTQSLGLEISDPSLAEMIYLTEVPSLRFWFEAFRELRSAEGRTPWRHVRDFGAHHGFEGPELDDFIRVYRAMEDEANQVAREKAPAEEVPSKR